MSSTLVGSCGTSGSSMPGRLKRCWTPRCGCSGCCRCCSRGATGRAPTWPTRLEVTTRTVRNDIERLRILGYQVALHAPASAGGYRLGAGSGACRRCCSTTTRRSPSRSGLRAAAAGTVTGIEETSLRALTKLEQTLPSRLRPAGRRAAARPPSRRRAAARPSTPRPDRDRRRAAATTSGCASTTRATTARSSVRRRRAAPAGLHRPPLVPAGLGHRPRATGARSAPTGSGRALPTGPRFTPARAPEATPPRTSCAASASPAWRHPARVRLHAPAGGDRRAHPADRRPADAGRRAQLPAGDRRRLAARPGRLPEQARRAVHRPRPAGAARPAAHARRPLPRPPPSRPRADPELSAWVVAMTTAHADKSEERGRGVLADEGLGLPAAVAEQAELVGVQRVEGAAVLRR